MAGPFCSIPEAIEEIRDGRMIVLVDDEDRENEGDLVCAAEMITPEIVNFMLKQGRGVLCVPLTGERCVELDFGQQTPTNTAQFRTAFTVTIDAMPKFGVSTGVSAADRCATILRTTVDDAAPSDFARPGHINPLVAREGGVLVRAGQTEGSVDLARLAKLKPAAVLIEVMSDDGSMMRVPELSKFCTRTAAGTNARTTTRTAGRDRRRRYPRSRLGVGQILGRWPQRKALARRAHGGEIRVRGGNPRPGEHQRPASAMGQSRGQCAHGSLSLGPVHL